MALSARIGALGLGLPESLCPRGPSSCGAPGAILACCGLEDGWLCISQGTGLGTFWLLKALWLGLRGNISLSRAAAEGMAAGQGPKSCCPVQSPQVHAGVRATPFSHPEGCLRQGGALC